MPVETKDKGKGGLPQMQKRFGEERGAKIHAAMTKARKKGQAPVVAVLKKSAKKSDGK